MRLDDHRRLRGATLSVASAYVVGVAVTILAGATVPYPTSIIMAPFIGAVALYCWLWGVLWTVETLGGDRDDEVVDGPASRPGGEPR